MHANKELYQNIATRTGGDIYIGVVGPVRTGKSTFIKRFMESLVLPQMEEGAKKERAKDEMPQSGSGKNVMTTEPKFVPEEAVRIQLEDGLGFRVKLVDCVGFTVPEAVATEEDGKTRLVNTPWSNEAMPFEEAAKLGTQKVIEEHSTIGVVVTTDGSFGAIKREQFITAENEVIHEMKQTQKPFVIVINSQHPNSDETKSLAALLEEKHAIPVLALNCFTMQEEEIHTILEKIVLEFPIRQIKTTLPSWILSLGEDHPIQSEMTQQIIEAFSSIQKTGECFGAIQKIEKNESILGVSISNSDLGLGSIEVDIRPAEHLFWEILSEKCKIPIDSEEALIRELAQMAELKQKYIKIAKALDEVEETGYGIVTPNLEDLSLEEPEIVKQAGGYGVKLKASAPSIHMIRANIQAEISPIVGSERQSEDIVKFLLKEFEEDPTQIWQSNMFGKSLYELVNEGLNTKLNHMPSDARLKLGETLQKIINEGSGGLICIIL